MGHAKTMLTITVELTIKVKNKFTSPNAEKTTWIHLTPSGKFSHPAIYSYLCYVSICNPARLRQIDPAKACPENTRL